MRKRGFQELVSLDELIQEPSVYGFCVNTNYEENAFSSDADPTYESVENKEAVTKACSLLEQVGAKYFAVLSFKEMGYSDDITAGSLGIAVNEVLGCFLSLLYGSFVLLDILWRASWCM